MAIRYSGDVEVRLTWNKKLRLYTGTVRAPRLVRRYRVDKYGRADPRSPEAYDRAALRMIKDLIERERAWGRKLPLLTDRLGRPRVDRVFQAPCPCEH